MSAIPEGNMSSSTFPVYAKRNDAFAIAECVIVWDFLVRIIFFQNLVQILSKIGHPKDDETGRWIETFSVP